jgi:hypothetical protein
MITLGKARFFPEISQFLNKLPAVGARWRISTTCSILRHRDERYLAQEFGGNPADQVCLRRRSRSWRVKFGVD